MTRMSTSMTTKPPTSRRSLRAHAFALATTTGTVLAMAAPGCTVRYVELTATANDASAPTPLSHPPAYGCGDWIDDELNALRVRGPLRRFARFPLHPR